MLRQVLYSPCRWKAVQIVRTCPDRTSVCWNRNPSVKAMMLVLGVVERVGRPRIVLCVIHPET